MIGPGKVELLERIDRCGSIAAAGREMGMSDKRAWELVGTLNAMFRDPVVESTRGGPGGGGAVLTDAGRAVLELYRGFEREAAEVGAARLADLQALRADIPEGKYRLPRQSVLVDMFSSPHCNGHADAARPCPPKCSGRTIVAGPDRRARLGSG